MSSGPSFEIPTEMRAFAEKSVAQAQQAFDGFINAARKAAEQAQETASTAQSGAKDMTQLAMTFAERNIASSFDFAQKLLHAKEAKEVLGLHSEYVKQQMDVLAEQARELSQCAVKMTGAKH